MLDIHIDPDCENFYYFDCDNCGGESRVLSDTESPKIHDENFEFCSRECFESFIEERKEELEEEGHLTEAVDELEDFDENARRNLGDVDLEDF